MWSRFSSIFNSIFTMEQYKYTEDELRRLIAAQDLPIENIIRSAEKQESLRLQRSHRSNEKIAEIARMVREDFNEEKIREVFNTIPYRININSRKMDQNNPFQAAISQGNVDAFKFLLELFSPHLRLKTMWVSLLEGCKHSKKLLSVMEQAISKRIDEDFPINIADTQQPKPTEKEIADIKALNTEWHVRLKERIDIVQGLPRLHHALFAAISKTQAEVDTSAKPNVERPGSKPVKKSAS